MLSFPDMFHLFANEFAGLGRRRFAFPLRFSSSFECFFLGHKYPPEKMDCNRIARNRLESTIDVGFTLS